MNHDVQKHNLLSNTKRFLKVSNVLQRELNNFKRFNKLNEIEKSKSLIPAQLVKTLIKLGPTFVKLGQILSTRPDYLPKEYINALKILHDQVPPFPYPAVESILRRELKQEMDKVFRSFRKKAVAAASLAQVHFAVLHDGTKVAVKIQRPRIEEIISRDLVVLSWLVNIVSKLYPKLSRNLNLKGALKEFKNYTLNELNFVLEGKTLDKFRQNFRDWDDIIFPKVYWNHTTQKVLVMERVSGMHLSEVKGKISVDNREKLSKRLIEFEMKMFISDAFFHADLHPGNIFFLEDGRLAVIDVGMFGKLTDQQRDRFLLYWLAIVEKEKRRAFSHLLKLGKSTKEADKRGFYKKFEKLLDQFYQADISTRSLTKTYLEIFITGASFGFRFPSELLLQAKAMTTAESLAMNLTPNLKFYEEARPIVTKELGRRARPEEMRKRLKQTVPEWLLFGESIDSELIFNKDEETKSEKGWEEVAKVWAKEFDDRRKNQNEVRHGEYEVIVNESLDKVFNFVTRFAQYPYWHPTYTEESKVIHVSGKYVFITPEVVGSVFRLDEIVDGNQLLSNAEVTGFERNRMFKWRAPLSLFPLIDLGTCFIFEDLGDNRTRLYEYFYFIDSSVMDFFIYRRWFSKEALTAHIKEELTGVKNIIESGKYNPEDMDYLWNGIEKTSRILYCDETGKPVEISSSI